MSGYTAPRYGDTRKDPVLAKPLLVRIPKTAGVVLTTCADTIPRRIVNAIDRDDMSTSGGGAWASFATENGAQD
jgi:hypothetical protein